MLARETPNFSQSIPAQERTASDIDVNWSPACSAYDAVRVSEGGGGHCAIAARGRIGHGRPITLEQACHEGRWVYRSMADLYPKLQLDSTQRDSLLRQLVLLRSRVKECEEEAKRFSDADCGRG